MPESHKGPGPLLPGGVKNTVRQGVALDQALPLAKQFSGTPLRSIYALFGKQLALAGERCGSRRPGTPAGMPGAVIAKTALKGFVALRADRNSGSVLRAATP